MKAYHSYITEALRRYEDRAFAYDLDTDEYLDEKALQKLADTAVRFAYKASIAGTWDGLAVIRHTRQALVGGVWYTVRTIAPHIEAPLPRLAIYTPNICSV